MTSDRDAISSAMASANGWTSLQTAYRQMISRDWPREEVSPKAERWVTAPVPLWLLQMEEVSVGGKLLYGRLMLYAGRHGRAYPNQVTLAADLGVSDRQVRRWVHELESLKLIEARKRGYRGPDHYVFLRHPAQDLPLRNWAMSPKQKAPEGSDGDDSA